MSEVLSLGGFLITRDEWELLGDDGREDVLSVFAIGESRQADDGGVPPELAGES